MVRATPRDQKSAVTIRDAFVMESYFPSLLYPPTPWSRANGTSQAASQLTKFDYRNDRKEPAPWELATFVY